MFDRVGLFPLMRAHSRLSASIKPARKMPACRVKVDKDVLGSLGNLIAVDKPALQELISWALSSNLELIITRSTSAAINCRVRLSAGRSEANH